MREDLSQVTGTMQIQTTTQAANRMLIGKGYCGETTAPGSQKPAFSRDWARTLLRNSIRDKVVCFGSSPNAHPNFLSKMRTGGQRPH